MDHTRKRSSDIRIALGTRLRALRLDRGLTQLAVAISTGISREHLVRLEHGQKEIGLLTLQALARALHTTMAELLDGL